MNVDILWSNFLGQIKDELTSLSFETWFSDTKLYRLHNGKAYIIVPMPIHKKHLIDNYASLISDKLLAITGSNYELVLLLKEEIQEKEELKEESVKTTSKYLENSNLKDKYTFENFIVGNSNKFAQAASL